jgi:hypothetical protein
VGGTRLFEIGDHMVVKALKITKGPVAQLQPALAHLAAIAKTSRGIACKKPPVFEIPRLYELQAMDSNAMGFIAIPKEYVTDFDDNVLTLKGFGEFQFEAPPAGTRLLKAKHLIMRSGVWCVEFDTESSSIPVGPNELVSRLQPNAEQKQQLHELFADLLLWQKYFRDWRRIPPYRKRLPAWAMKVMFRDALYVRPSTLWAVTNMANTRLWPKGIQHLEILRPRYDGDVIWIDGVDGKVQMDIPANTKFVGIRIEYCKKTDVFTATFRRK